MANGGECWKLARTLSLSYGAGVEMSLWWLLVPQTAAVEAGKDAVIKLRSGLLKC